MIKEGILRKVNNMIKEGILRKVNNMKVKNNMYIT